MDEIWRVSSLLLLFLAIWHFKNGDISVGNQLCIMAFIAQILAKMEGIEK